MEKRKNRLLPVLLAVLAVGLVLLGLDYWNLLPHRTYTAEDFGIETLQSPLDADGDGIARLDHVVILDAAAHEAQNFLHGSVFLPGNRVKFQFAISENESKLKKKRDFKSIDCAKLKWC